MAYAQTLTPRPGLGLPGTGALVVLALGTIALALPIATRMHLTWVDTVVEGADAFFPCFYPEQWRIVASQAHLADTAHALAFDFVDYVRS